MPVLTTSLDICAWLDSYRVTNYSLEPDEKYGFRVCVQGDVYLGDQKLSYLPVKFGRVSGKFEVYNNCLSSFEFFPDEVGHYLDFSHNAFTSLKSLPQVLGDINANNNNLSSLEGCPFIIYGSFYCGHNRLRTLKGAPRVTERGFYCENNALTSLKYCPQQIGGNFVAENNNLQHLLYFPKFINGFVYLDNNRALGDFQEIRMTEKIQQQRTIYLERHQLKRVLRKDNNKPSTHKL